MGPSELELARRYCDLGDTQARQLLVERFVPLAVKLARRYEHPSAPFDELITVTVLGLLRAIDNLDQGLPAAPSDLAVQAIVADLKRYFRDSPWALHTLRDDQQRALRVHEGIESLSARLGRTPTPGEIAAEIGETSESVLEAMELAVGYRPEPA